MVGRIIMLNKSSLILDNLIIFNNSIPKPTDSRFGVTHCQRDLKRSLVLKD